MLAAPSSTMPPSFFGQFGAMNPVEAGELISARREARGLTQEQVAEQLNMKNANYLSYLEKGKVNLARSKYFAPLAKLLRLSEEDVRAISPDAVFVLPDQEEGKYSNGSPIKPVVQWEDDETLMEIPATLQRVLDKLSKDYAELADPRSVKSILPRFLDGGGPQTEDEWRDYILFNIRWIKRAKN